MTDFKKISKSLFSLKGKVAVITGGAGFLGKYFSAALAQFGAKVAILDLIQKETELVANEIQKRYKVQTLGIGCDISAQKKVTEAIQIVAGKFGGIHILHNNAATRAHDLKAFLAPFEDYKIEMWKKIMSVNLDGMFLAAQAVGKQMIKQKTGGSIIQTASIYGLLGADHRIYEGSQFHGLKLSTPAVYAASKGGILALTKYLATYWAKQGIRVNTLTPGGVEATQNETFKQKYSERVPLGRMAQPSELVGALIYLASDASSYVTGQNIIVDGGLSVW